jgi:hypothetical protein
MWKRLVSVFVAFVAVPLVLALVRNFGAFSSSSAEVAARSRLVLETIALHSMAQFVVAATILVLWQPSWLQRLWYTLGASATSGLVATPALFMLAPAVAPFERLVLVSIWSSTGLGVVAFALHTYLNRPPPPLVEDPLKPLALQTPHTFEQLNASPSAQYRVRVGFFSCVGWIGAALSLGLAAANQPTDTSDFTFLALIFFGVLGLYLPASTGWIEITVDSLTHQNVFGKFQIHWDEVLRVEVSKDQYQGSMVLFGADKHLSIYSPRHWTGPHAGKARSLLAEILKARALAPEATTSSGYRFNRNVRVRAEG